MLPFVGETAMQAGPSLLSYQGQMETNAANAQQAYEANRASRENAKSAWAFDARMARENRKFQERMSNSAMQRSVKDMEKAGINPLLGIAKGGASTPAGSAASGSAADVKSADFDNPMKAFEQVTGNVLQAKQLQLNTKKLGEEIKTMESNRRNIDMDTKVKSRTLPEAEMKNYIYNGMKKLLEKSGSSAVKNQGRDRTNETQPNIPMGLN